MAWLGNLICHFEVVWERKWRVSVEPAARIVQRWENSVDRFICLLYKTHPRVSEIIHRHDSRWQTALPNYQLLNWKIVESTITHAAETWCLKAKKTVAKLNSTEMDFWRRSARISRKDKIRNNIIKQKMNVTRSLLDEIKTKQLKWYGHVQRMEEGRLPKKSYVTEPTRKKKTR